MTEVTINNVRKTYPNGFKAIHAVDVDIADGEFIVLVGPSGCGKSTLLRMIAGLETTTEGTISIGNRVVNDLEPSARDIAMVFQNYALYPHMNVFNNMAYGLKIKGLPKSEIEARVKQAADILELTDDQMIRKPRELSGGQRQRVAMGRAIVREPSVFLFDEPLSNLDAKLRGQMRLEIKQLQQRLGITSIYVTHDQVEAMTLGHRLIVLNGGNVEQTGTPIEVYERPSSVFVAGFIGSPTMNLLEASVGPDGAYIVLAGTTIPAGQNSSLLPGRKIILGVRPEHLKETDGADGLAVKVSIVEQLGADTLVHGLVGGDGENDAKFTVRLSGIRRIATNDIITVRPAQESLHFFDPETQRRI